MVERASLRERELAQAEGQRTVSEINRIQLEIAKLDLLARAENWRVDQARDFHNNRFIFSELVDLPHVLHCMETLSVWDRLDPGCVMEVVFHSPGGEVMPGLALFDHIRHLSKKGHHMTTSVYGYAASMAAILLQAGDTRVVGRESYVFLHEITTQAMGTPAALTDAAKSTDLMQNRILDIFVSRSGGLITKRGLQKRWKQKEWCLDSRELLKWGLVDEVR